MAADRFTGIRQVLKFRKALEGLAALAPSIAGLWLTLRLGVPDFVVAGVLVAPVAWFVMRVMIEIVDVVAETLLPR